MELISVIVPVYNVEKYLLRCVTSIQNQTYKNLEIILVDDGSPDRCPQMCDQFAVEDPRIKVVHKENGGLGFAWNSGLDVATGKYVTFIDSDDWIREDHIENLYSALTQNSADVVIGTYTAAFADGTEVPRCLQLSEGVYEGEEVLQKILLPLFGPDINYPKDVQVNASSCMNLYRLDLIQNNNLRYVSERYAVGEDLYFNVDVFHYAQKVVALNENGYFYYQNRVSLSRKYDPKRFERTINCYRKLQEQAETYQLKDRISYRIERTFLGKIRVAFRLLVCSDLRRKDKFQEIKRFLNHELVCQVLKNYPIHTFPSSMRVFAQMMRAKNVAGVYYMIKLRELARR